MAHGARKQEARAVTKATEKVCRDVLDRTKVTNLHYSTYYLFMVSPNTVNYELETCIYIVRANK